MVEEISIIKFLRSHGDLFHKYERKMIYYIFWELTQVIQ